MIDKDLQQQIEALDDTNLTKLYRLLRALTVPIAIRKFVNKEYAKRLVK